MADLVKSADEVSMDANKAPMIHLFVWQKSIKQLMINIRTRDSYELEEARLSLKDSQNEITLFEEQFVQERKLTKADLFKFRMSESIRRLCAYARDFGEVLLNIKLYDEMIVDRSDD